MMSIGGQPVAVTRSNSPQLRNFCTPGGWMHSVETVSLGKVARSTSSTR